MCQNTTLKSPIYIWTPTPVPKHHLQLDLVKKQQHVVYDTTKSARGHTFARHSCESIGDTRIEPHPCPRVDTNKCKRRAADTISPLRR